MKKIQVSDHNLWENYTKDIKKLTFAPKEMKQQTRENLHVNHYIKPILTPKLNTKTALVKDAILKGHNLITDLGKKLSKNFKIQRSLDLHGLTIERANNVLENFINNCQLQGVRFVLIITGKGHKTNDTTEGIMRGFTRNWIKNNSGQIISYSAAKPHHGGDGAFYVRLRNIYKR